jgi:uncharacterized membrane protein
MVPVSGNPPGRYPGRYWNDTVMNTIENPSIQRPTRMHPLRIYADLILGSAWLVITMGFIFHPSLQESVLRVFFAVPLILFLPGYMLVAALFPRAQDLDSVERVTFSIGLSLALVPLVGLALNYSPWGIHPVPLITAILSLTFLFTLTAWIRRRALPARNRFMVRFESTARKTLNSVAPRTSSWTDRLVSIVLLLSVLVAIGAAAYVLTVPQEGKHLTAFYLLGLDGKAEGYPRALLVGESYPVIIGIGNYEYRSVTYSVEIFLINMTFDPESNISHVESMRELDRFSVTLSHNATEEIVYNVTIPPALGYNRIEFLLFNETVPDSTVRNMDRINASYRDLHLWVDIDTGVD